MIRKPPSAARRRLQSGLATVAGVVLLVFEIRQLQKGSVEAYFWLMVAVLMIALGVVGLIWPVAKEDDLQ